MNHGLERADSAPDLGHEGLGNSLRATVPEPPRLLDPDAVMRGAHVGQRRRRAVASATATALIIAAAAGIVATRVEVGSAVEVASEPGTTPSNAAPGNPAAPDTPAAARVPATFPEDGWYLVVLVDESDREQERQALQSARAVAVAGGYPEALVMASPGLYCQGRCPAQAEDLKASALLVLSRLQGPDATDPATADSELTSFEQDVAGPARAAAVAAGLHEGDVVVRWLPFSDVYPEDPPTGYPAGDPATDAGDRIGRDGALNPDGGTTEPVTPGIPVYAVLTTMGEVDAASGGHTPQVPPGRLVWVVSRMERTAIPPAPATQEFHYGEAVSYVLDASTGFDITGLIGPPLVSPQEELIWQ